MLQFQFRIDQNYQTRYPYPLRFWLVASMSGISILLIEDINFNLIEYLILVLFP